MRKYSACTHSTLPCNADSKHEINIHRERGRDNSRQRVYVLRGAHGFAGENGGARRISRTMTEAHRRGSGYRGGLTELGGG